MKTKVKVTQEDANGLGTGNDMDDMYLDYDDNQLYLTIEKNEECFIMVELNKENVIALENGLKAFREIDELPKQLMASGEKIKLF